MRLTFGRRQDLATSDLVPDGSTQAAPGAPALSIRGLTVRYGNSIAVSGVDLEVSRGMTLAIIGPNGSGKSTLLHAIMGLVPPAQGSVDCDRSSLSLVMQATQVDHSLPITVRETVRIARYANLGLLRRFRQRDIDAVEHALRRLAVDDLADRQLHDLSGGQRQRVLVAQGLAQQAGVLLLDEPTTGLDVVSRELILDAVSEESRTGTAVVMTTHSLDDAQRCDRVLLIANRVVAFGTPAQVIQDGHLRQAFGRRFLDAT